MGWWRLLGRALVIVIVLRLVVVVRKLEVEHDEQDQCQNPADNQILHVGKPEPVLHLPGLLLKLRGPVLQRVRPLIQLGQLVVPVENLLNIILHDAHDLVDLRLLLGHASLCHDLLHLLGSGKRFAVGAQRAAIGAGLHGRVARHVAGVEVVSDEVLCVTWLLVVAVVAHSTSAASGWAREEERWREREKKS
jgi:hypothetical protein